MVHRILGIGSICLLTLLCGCAGLSSQTNSSSVVPSTLHVEDLFPKSQVAGLPDTLIRDGIMALSANDLNEASSLFNQALKRDPRNSYIQFLNGLTYHLRAESGEAGQYEFARLGYELALKFDKSNQLAAQQLARYYLKKKEYRQAQEYFAQALLNQPDNAELLYGLAKASYYRGDLEAARGALRRAKELLPRNPGIISGYAVTSAALGESESAAALLEEFRTIDPSSPKVQRVADRIREWHGMYQSQQQDRFLVADAGSDSGFVPLPLDSVPETKDSAPATLGGAPQNIVQNPPQNAPTDPKMVVIDVTMIRTEGDETTNRGLNLLDGIKLQFSGDVTAQSSYASSAGDAFSRLITGKLSIPQIDYNLNIFNSSNDRNEVLARPTIIALDGKESRFFAGSILNVAVTGQLNGSLEKVETGITLQVTPTFLPDGSMQLSLVVSRSFFETEAAGKFAESVKISKNEVSANVIMKYGQTLILSGLREKEISEGKSGVPILMDIPVVQYLFSNKTTSDFHRSILILLTPRRVIPGVNVSDEVAPREEELQALKEFKERYRYIFNLGDNLSTIMRHGDKHEVLRKMVLHEIRDTDLSDSSWWGSSDSVATMLKRAVSFLYY